MTARQRYALIFERAVPEPSEEVVRHHQQRLCALRDEGRVVLAGPFAAGGGLVILDVEDEAEARQIADADPFVRHATHTYRLMRWLQDLGPGTGGPHGASG